MNNVVIFGTSKFSEMMKYYLDVDSDNEVVAFTINSDYITNPIFCGLPVIPFEMVETVFPPFNYKMLVALGYSRMNDLRKSKYIECKNKGFECINYISSRSIVLTDLIGENNIILEAAIIQPFVNIGNCNVLWSGCLVGHHASIRNFCFIAGMATVGGNVIVEDNCFIGNNSTTKNDIKIAYKTLIGASTYIAKDTKSEDVYTPMRSVKINVKSSDVTI